MELQNNYEQFRAKKAEILAVAFQNIAHAQQAHDLIQAQYPILADADHAVAEAYGVFNLLGDGVATPSVFVIDPNGQLSWSFISKDPNVRPSASDILTHVSP